MINKSAIQKETIQSAIVLHIIHYISCLYLMLFRATLLRFVFFFDSLHFNDQHANQIILCALFWSRNEFSLFIYLNILWRKMYRCPGFSYLIREYDFLWRNSTWAMAFLLSTKSKKNALLYAAAIPSWWNMRLGENYLDASTTYNFANHYAEQKKIKHVSYW